MTIIEMNTTEMNFWATIEQKKKHFLSVSTQTDPDMGVMQEG